jgi:hypothetical protein
MRPIRRRTGLVVRGDGSGVSASQTLAGVAEIVPARTLSKQELQ